MLNSLADVCVGWLNSNIKVINKVKTDNLKTKLKLFFCTILFAMFFQSASYADDLEDAFDASGCRNDMSANCSGVCTRNGDGAILLNSDGGTLIFGVADNDGEIVGVDDDEVEYSKTLKKF